MDVFGDGPHNVAALRLSRIEQFPEIRLSQDDVHSNCSICICSLTKGEMILLLPCLHKFHSCCIRPWLSKSNTCPTCRENVFDGVDGIGDASSEDENSNEDVAAIENTSDDSSIETSSPAAVLNLIGSYFNSSDESDMSFDQNSISVDVSSINSSFDIDDDDEDNSTTEMIESGSDDVSTTSPIASTIASSQSSDDSDNESQRISSSNESSEGSDSSNAMFPSSDDGSSSNAWEMSDDFSD